MYLLPFLETIFPQDYVAAFVVLGAAGIFLLFLPVFHDVLLSPTRKVPGPFWARVTRCWELKTLFQGDSNQVYIRLHQKYGSIVRVGPNRYSFSAPADVKFIYELRSKFVKSEYYEPVVNPDPNKRNIFTLRDPIVHKERRRKIANLYSMSTMVSYNDAVDKMTRICIRKLRQFADEERRFSLPDFMQCYAFDVIGEITFNQDFGMMENEGDTTGIVKCIHNANSYLAHVGLLPGLHPWIRRIEKLVGKDNDAAAVVNFALAQLTKHREANDQAAMNKSYRSFLEKLVQLEAEHRVDISHILDSCGSNIAAGSDTTAITLSSALYYLYKDPEKLAKFRHEIDTKATEGHISDPVSFREAQDMPYLQSIIKETLRMHPAVGTILARKVPKGGASFGGIYFPEGTEVGANPWVLHYSKDIYGPDAGVFKPERWLDKKKEGTLEESMMFAFGGGSRACIGKNISLLEMTKVLPQIVREFDFVFENESKPMDTYCALFVYPKFKVQIKMREDV